MGSPGGEKKEMWNSIPAFCLSAPRAGADVARGVKRGRADEHGGKELGAWLTKLQTMESADIVKEVEDVVALSMAITADGVQSSAVEFRGTAGDTEAARAAAAKTTLG